MKVTHINAYSKKEEYALIFKLRKEGYKRVENCMRVHIFRKDDNEIVISREF